MATPAVIVVVTVALGSLVALAVVVLALLHRLKELLQRLEEVRGRLDPQSRTVGAELEAARRQIDELDRAMNDLRGRTRKPRVH